MKTFLPLILVVLASSSIPAGAAPKEKCDYAAVEAELTADPSIAPADARAYRLAAESLVATLDTFGLRLGVPPYAVTIAQFRSALARTGYPELRQELVLSAIRSLQLYGELTHKTINDPLCIGME